MDGLLSTLPSIMPVALPAGVARPVAVLVADAVVQAVVRDAAVPQPQALPYRRFPAQGLVRELVQQGNLLPAPRRVLLPVLLLRLDRLREVVEAAQVVVAVARVLPRAALRPAAAALAALRQVVAVVVLLAAADVVAVVVLLRFQRFQVWK